MTATLLSPAPLLRHALRSSKPTFLTVRAVSTVPNSPHVHIHPDPSSSNTHILSLLSTPPTAKTRSLTLATTTAIPPTTASTSTNPDFLILLNSILAQHAVHDPIVKASAASFASNAGSTLGSGGALFVQQTSAPRRRGAGGSFSERMAAKKAKDQAEKSQSQTPEPPTPSGAGGGAGQGGAGGANYQGGHGGASRGGWIHVSDQRRPPDWGRIADPEDIFGSLEVDGEGKFVGANGNWQSSGTYRLITPDGILGLSGYLREKVVERLRELERELEGKFQNAEQKDAGLVRSRQARNMIDSQSLQAYYLHIWKIKLELPVAQIQTLKDKRPRTTK